MDGHGRYTVLNARDEPCGGVTNAMEFGLLRATGFPVLEAAPDHADARLSLSLKATVGQIANNVAGQIELGTHAR